MKATITVEFTGEELVKHAEDAGRRVGLNFIRDGVKSLSRLKIPPSTAEILGQALESAMHAKHASSEAPDFPKGPVPKSPIGLEQCLRCDSEDDPHRDDGWFCCRCSVFNGTPRAACRNCAHGRCDVVVPPPPAPSPSVQ